MSGPAFSKDFQERISLGKYTSWAVDLDADTLQVLLWMVGEFGIRPYGPACDFDDITDKDMAYHPKHPYHPRQVVALKVLRKIMWGESFNMDKAKQLIHNAMD